MAKSNSKAVEIKKAEAFVAGVLNLTAKLAEATKEREAHEAERDAERKKHQHRIENPIEYLSNEDIKAIESRLSSALHSCYAINRLAYDGIGNGCDDVESMSNLLVSVAEMSRANVRGLDACIQRISGGTLTGLFETEFDQD